MKALIDADMPAMELGGIKEQVGENEDGTPIVDNLGWKETWQLAKGRLTSIFIQSEAGGYEAFLTRGRTFRHDIATIQPYKGNRAGKERPKWADKIKEYYHKKFNAKWCDGYEADDAMSMIQWKAWYEKAKVYDYNEEYIKRDIGTVICSRDKDLDTVPGWHFKWTLKRDKDKQVALGEVARDKPPYYVPLVDATRNFYRQLLTGDAVDNIKGLYRIGPKSEWVKQLDDMTNEAQMYEHVKEKYDNYFSSYGKQFMDETGKLLWMWRKPGDVWVPPPERDGKWYEI